ncbi:serine/threonine-protein kinase [Micromonospora sp. NPDC049523]|uniref:serine/threonine-protein kinase n=1 Tax=Micromonospora sp. NPDC049523 TaxID=3155921 RepID=UPI003431F2AF
MVARMSSPEPRLPRHLVIPLLGSEAELLGVGTYGDTWRSGDRAVKILCGAPTDPRRVTREVEALQRVDNPHVVRLYGLRRLSISSNDYQALEFEFVPGGDISERITAKDWPTVEQATSLLIALLQGLQALHESGSIHRDLKPANIALRSRSWALPVILDLGLAKQLDASTVTIYPGLLGTPAYMAPEQLRGQPAHKASDLFAVGVVIHQLLLGRHPLYDPSESYELPDMLRLIESGIPPISLEYPEALRRVVTRLTSVQAYRRGSTRSNLQILGLG